MFGGVGWKAVFSQIAFLGIVSLLLFHFKHSSVFLWKSLQLILLSLLQLSGKSLHLFLCFLSKTLILKFYAGNTSIL